MVSHVPKNQISTRFFNKFFVTAYCFDFDRAPLLYSWCDIPIQSIFCFSRVGQHRKTFNLIKLKRWSIIRLLQLPDLKRPENYITRYGKFLRKTSLDEVPQFFNVLRGEMTLVGPRFGLITQRELLELRSKCGLEGLRPGLTGLAQITYRDSASDRLKAKVDALYLKNAGFCLDIWILTRTLLQVFFPVNVHH